MFAQQGTAVLAELLNTSLGSCKSSSFLICHLSAATMTVPSSQDVRLSGTHCGRPNSLELSFRWTDSD